MAEFLGIHHIFTKSVFIILGAFLTLFLFNLLLISILFKYKKWSFFQSLFELKIAKIMAELLGIYHIFDKKRAITLDAFLTLFLFNLLLISILFKYKKWSLFKSFFELKLQNYGWITRYTLFWQKRVII